MEISKDIAVPGGYHGCSSNLTQRFREIAACVIAGIAIAIPLSVSAFAAPNDGSDEKDPIPRSAGNTQTSPSDGGNEALKDIVVTAQRRPETLQSVPISISAVTAAEAEHLDIRNVQDLQLITPGLNYQAPYTYAQIFIRGVGTPFANPGLETSVAVYVDGVYLERQLGTVFDLVDPATTEVLKGPQGTLYGRNATGGVILLNTADPTHNSEGRIGVEYGRFNKAKLDFMVNEPLSDTVDLRIAVRAENDDGYIRNEFDGDELGGMKSYVARAKLSWHPTDEFSLLFTTEYIRDHADGAALGLRSSAPLCLVCALYPGIGAVAGTYVTNQNIDSPAITDSILTSLKATENTDTQTFSEAIAFRRFTWSGFNEVDLTPINFFTFGSAIGGNTYTVDFQDLSKFSGPINYLAGLSLLQDNGYFDAALSGDAFGGLPAVPNSSDVQTKSAAGFIEANYQPTEQFRLTVGGRYSYEKKLIEGTNFPTAQLVFGSAGFSDSDAFKSFTPRVVATYEIPVGNLYASFTKGFKSGGFNTPAFSAENAVKPETIKNYEVGAKLKLLDRMTLNMAAFHYDYTDLQVNIIDIANGGAFLENAGKARANGAEFDVAFSVTRQLLLSAGTAYLDAYYVDYRAGQIYAPAASGVGLQATDTNLSGTALPRSPRFSGYLSASQDIDFGNDWTGNLSAIGNYTSKFLLTAGAGGPLQYNIQTSHEVVNLTGSLSPPGGAFRFGFYIDNLTNNAYIANSDTTQYGLYRTYARPRTYGLRAGYKF